MAELDPNDLPASTRARLSAAGVDAQGEIDAALAASRRWCGWHVSPVRVDDVLDVDGVDGYTNVLSLPTMNLLSVSSVTELGVSLDVSGLDRSRRKGTLTKQSGCWSRRDGSIVATVTHGLTEVEAADWRRAVVSMVTARSFESKSKRDGPDMKRKKIDDVEYEWFEALIDTDAELQGRFSQFRILPSP